jgi:hypothetical protein
MTDLKVVPIVPVMDIPKMLRNLADELESTPVDRVTVILSDGDVRIFGGIQETIALHLVFDCQMAIFRAMTAGYQVPVVINSEEM